MRVAGGGRPLRLIGTAVGGGAGKNPPRSGSGRSPTASDGSVDSGDSCASAIAEGRDWTLHETKPRVSVARRDTTSISSRVAGVDMGWAGMLAKKIPLRLWCREGCGKEWHKWRHLLNISHCAALA